MSTKLIEAQTSKEAWPRVAKVCWLLFLSFVVSYGCRELRATLIEIFPDERRAANAAIAVLFSVLIVYLSIKPLARQFGYDWSK